MAKIIHIMAVSLSSGLVLGAGLRALENRPRKPKPPDRPADEHKTQLDPHIGGSAQNEPSLGAVIARLDAHDAETDAVLARLSAMEKVAARTAETTETLGLELRGWAASDIRRQILEVEARLSKNLDAARRETLEAVVEGVQLRVSERITKLEQQVTGQASALIELGECSVKTERGLQKLLMSIDRLVAIRGMGATSSTDASASRRSEPSPDDTAGARRKDDSEPTRRWSLFG